jgi:tetratricopeptide (TPR) repeat protein
MEAPDNQNDPGYALYKEGYNLILEERWNEAREQFGTLITKYAKSEYVDDAQYWSAYALMQTDRKKAVTAYQKFIESYPKSSYYDDAVADLGQLRSGVFVVTPGTPHPVVTPLPDGEGFHYEFGPNSRQFERQMMKMERQLSRMRVKPPHLPGMFAPRAERENLDKETRLKMEALYALGDGKEDEKSFQTLKEVAVNTRQPRPLREAAMDAIAQYEQFDVMPVFVEIAKKDTSTEIQSYAIDYIGERGKDKNKTVETLVELFYALPKSRKEQTQTIFYAVAEVGNDKAVDFLTKVALSHDDYNLSTDSVYYLGSIGGEKARSALYQILNEKK